MNFKNKCSLLVIAFSLLSCNKDVKSQVKAYESHLPNYGNVNIDKVFSSKECILNNETKIVDQTNDYFQKIWEGGDLSGGVLIAKGNKIIFEKYRGFGRENSQMPINENTPLHVASVSKTMTAMAVLKLVEAGKLNLDDNLNKFFPKFPYSNITVFSLLTHRSGLPKYEYFEKSIKPSPGELKQKFISNQDVLNILIKYKPALAKPSNTGFMYGNINYALLALVIEKVTETPYSEAMQEMIFKPLKMKHTFVFQEKDFPTASQSYIKGSKVFPISNLDLVHGDKNIFTTPRDLLNFSIALYSKDFLKPELMAKVFEPYSNEKKGVNNYGFGFRMKEFENGEKLTYHNGWWHGSNAVFAHLLKSKVTIIAIGNRYSREVYSALSLSGLFEDFPHEKEQFDKTMNK